MRAIIILLLLVAAHSAMADAHVAITSSGRIVTLNGHLRAAAVRVTGAVADVAGDYCTTDTSGGTYQGVAPRFYRVEGTIGLFQITNPGPGDYLALSPIGNEEAAYSRTGDAVLTISGPWSNGVTVEDLR
jgi:hypothetical protein